MEDQTSRFDLSSYRERKWPKGVQTNRDSITSSFDVVVYTHRINAIGETINLNASKHSEARRASSYKRMQMCNHRINDADDARGPSPHLYIIN